MVVRKNIHHELKHSNNNCLSLQNPTNIYIYPQQKWAQEVFSNNKKMKIQDLFKLNIKLSGNYR